MSADFTLTKYRELLETALKAGYAILPIVDYLRAGLPAAQNLLLRHDVDRRPWMALRMARLERDLGVRSTYYFRAVRHTFRPDVIAEIHGLGHEIGYHYETLADSRGDIAVAFELFQEHLSEMRQITPVQTISMHGRPLSPWDSREIWNHYDFKTLDLEGEAYLSIDYTKVRYFNDTGRTWHPTRHNVRDFASASPREELGSTDDLITVIDQLKHPVLCVSAHPDRWAHSPARWVLSMFEDSLVNGAKVVLKRMRRRTLSSGHDAAKRAH